MPSNFEDFIAAVKTKQPMLVARSIGMGIDVDQKISSKGADNDKTAFQLTSDPHILNLLRLGKWLKADGRKLLVNPVQAIKLTAADIKAGEALPQAPLVAAAAAGGLPPIPPLTDQKHDFDTELLKPFALEIFRAACRYYINDNAKLVWGLGILEVDAVNARMATVPYLAVISGSAMLVRMVCARKPQETTLLIIPHTEQYRILAKAIDVFAKNKSPNICQVVGALLEAGADVDEDVIHLLDKYHDQLGNNFYAIVDLILLKGNIIIHPDFYHKILYRIARDKNHEGRPLNPANLTELISRVDVNHIGALKDTYFYWAARNSNLGLFIKLCRAGQKPAEATLLSQYNGGREASRRLLGILEDSRTRFVVEMINALVVHHGEDTSLGKQLLDIKNKRVAADQKSGGVILNSPAVAACAVVKVTRADEKDDKDAVDPIVAIFDLNLKTQADNPELLRDWLIQAIKFGKESYISLFIAKIIKAKAYAAFVTADKEKLLPLHHLLLSKNPNITNKKVGIIDQLLGIAPYSQLCPAQSGKMAVEYCGDTVDLQAALKPKENHADLMDLWWYVKEFFNGKASLAEFKFFDSLLTVLNQKQWQNAITLMQEQADCRRIPLFGGPYHLSDICRGILINIGAGYSGVAKTNEVKEQNGELDRLHSSFINYVKAYPESFSRKNMPGLFTTGPWIGPAPKLTLSANGTTTPPPPSADVKSGGDGAKTSAAATTNGTAATGGSTTEMLPALSAGTKPAGNSGADPMEPLGQWSSPLVAAFSGADADHPKPAMELQPVGAVAAAAPNPPPPPLAAPLTVS